ncbi:MAG: RsmE family RNA methyltransferase [Candidatus Aminicenantales bacterium]
MTSNFFFIRKSQLQSSSVVLDGEEHHHLSNVVRLKPRDRVRLFDEDGTKYLAEIDEIAREWTRLRILTRRERDRNPVKIILAQALIRAKKMEFILQMATELGISMLVPVLSARSIVKIADRSRQKVERWNKIARESAKQCKSGLVPKIAAPLSLKAFLIEQEGARKFYLSERRGTCLREILTSGHWLGPGSGQDGEPSEIIILVGPEGGWAEEEENLIAGHGYEAVSLGKNILRAETAALAAVAIVSLFWMW